MASRQKEKEGSAVHPLTMVPDDPHDVDVVGGTYRLTDAQVKTVDRLARKAAKRARTPAARESIIRATTLLLKADIIGLDPPR
jgi:hypothetical protein